MALTIKGTKVKPVVKSFNCLSCGSPVKIHVVGHTLNVVCPSCKAIIDAKDPNFRIIQKLTNQKKYTPYIPLNNKGKLKGKLWECTGFVVKSDSGYYWQEYLLYNPYEGYRWLVEVNGHWVLYKKIYRAVEDASSVISQRVRYKQKKFRLFNDGTARVTYVEGEFYWRIKAGNASLARDYIAPPESLSVEISKNEENWSLGIHIDAETIQKAFQVGNPPPYSMGVGMAQPSPIKEKLQKCIKPMLTSLVVLFGLWVIRGITASNKLVHQSYHSVSSEEDFKKTIKTEEFEISGRTSNIRIHGTAPILNSWLYADAILINVDSQKGIPIPLEISYYRGGDWSEGSRSSSRIINNVPPGRYYLNLKLQKGPTFLRGNFYLEIRRDVTFNSNMFMAVILILLGPLFTFFRSRSFEVSRWSNSDYSPYQSE